MTASRVRGHRERLLLSANEVGTWGPVSLRLCLSASHEGSGGYECLPSDTNAIFSYLRPGLQAALTECGMECECCWVRGVTHIRFCPVGKITNGSEIAVPQSGSSLLNKCSHANRQSPHKPHGWCSPLLHLRSLINCPHTNTVCVALYVLLMWPVIYCFASYTQVGWAASRDRKVKQTV